MQENRAVENFYIITNRSKDPDYQVTNQIRDFLQKKGKNCYIQQDNQKRKEKGHTDSTGVPENIDCVLVLGGDGTMLQAAADLADLTVPFLGINLGTLGFLAEVNKTDIEHALLRLIEGDYEIEKRMMLTGDVFQEDRDMPEDSTQALNDIVLCSSAGLQVMRVVVYVNGQYLYAYNCDGVIFATPTGSTAYNLSANGPIVNPMTNLILLTPINPHTLNARSIVLDPYDELVIEIESRREDGTEEAEISFDGNHKRLLHPGEKLVVHRAKETTKMIHLRDVSFLDRIRTKLQADDD